jgi:hypothetical protein
MFISVPKHSGYACICTVYVCLFKPHASAQTDQQNNTAGRETENTHTSSSFLLRLHQLGLALVAQDADLPVEDVDHVLLLVGHVEAEALADGAVPVRPELLVEAVLDQRRRRLSSSTRRGGEGRDTMRQGE